MPPRTRRQRRDHTPEDELIVVDSEEGEELAVENDLEIDNIEADAEESLFEEENDENTPILDEHSSQPPPPPPVYAPVHRSSSVFAARTPHSRSAAPQDTPLRDITDQFFHPPSPSPVRVSKSLKRSAPNTIEPPRRPKKPKSLAYPADPPNWLYSRASSSLPPSSPLPPSTSNFDHVHPTSGSRGHGHHTSARYEYQLNTPTKASAKASDSDPFGFFAVERALKAKRAALPVPVPAPRKPIPKPARPSAVKSPPRSTVATSTFSNPLTFSQLNEPIPTNNEDIDGLYSDEPIPGPSRPSVPAAPLLTMRSDQPPADIGTTHSQPTFPDPLRTPRKRKRRASLSLDDDLDSEASDVPSSPSPVKVSVGTSSNRRQSDAHIPIPIAIPRITRAQSKGRVVQRPTVKRTTQTATRKQVKISDQHIPTPSSTPASTRRSKSSSPPTPVAPRRSTRRAAAGANAKLKGAGGDSDDGGGRMKLRARSTKGNTEVKSKPMSGKAKKPESKSKATSRTQKATTAKPTSRGRPKGKPTSKDTKGKGKANALEDVLGMSDASRERYEKERRDRQEYFKRLEGYQMQKENVYVV